MFTIRRCHSLGSCMYFRVGGEKSRSCPRKHPGLERDKYMEDFERVIRAYAHSAQRVHLSHFHKLVDNLGQTTICQENLGKISSKTKRMSRYLSRMTEKKIMNPFYTSTLNKYHAEREQYWNQRLPHLKRSIPQLVKAQFNKIDSYTLNAIEKPIPSVQCDVRIYKQTKFKFSVKEAPARINTKQPEQESPKQARKSSSLQRLDVPLNKHHVQIETIYSELSLLNTWFDVQYQWLNNVYELSADLKHTDKYFSKVHRKARAKREKIRVLWSFIDKKILELNNDDHTEYTMLRKRYEPLFSHGDLINKANEEYQDHLANETRSDIDSI